MILFFPRIVPCQVGYVRSFLLSHEAASFSLKGFSVRVESEHAVFLLCGQSLLFWIFF